MKSLKKYFSPPPTSVTNGKIEEKDEDVSNKEKEETIICKTKHAKEISGDSIVKNMEEVLKSVSKKRKKEKHKRKHHKEKERTKQPATEVSEPLNGETEKSPVPDCNKENFKKLPNAFQLMMNARKPSVGSGLENLERTPSTSSQKRKRKDMLQEWTDNKEDCSPKDTEETSKSKKRATRSKNLLTNGKNSNEEVAVEDDLELAITETPVKKVKKRKKRQKLDASDYSQETTSKLDIKKRDSLLGYFSKVSKNDEGSMDKADPDVKKSNQNNNINEKGKESPEEQLLPKHTPSHDRPRRSCTLAPRSYKFESPPSNKKKPDVQTKKVKEDKAIIILSDEDSTDLAPIFHKKVPKPAELVVSKPDIPRSETIRLGTIRPKESGDFHMAFPIVSHVTQFKEEDPIHEPIDWTLSKIKLAQVPDDLLNDSSFALRVLTLELQFNENPKPQLSWCHVKDRKACGRKLKVAFEAFPTYKCFHQLQKQQKNSQEATWLFTEKYKPRVSEQFLINSLPVAYLKRFLSSWKESKGDPVGDFEESSRCSSSSSMAGSNVILIHGPSGSGKTSSVLALANEMRFNVLEINAGEKRTGKKMLQELQEATQSHHLCKGEEKGMKKLKSQEASNDMSLILIEDADVMFEQDDGFVSGISQLVSFSKRPVILTAINASLPHLTSYLNQNSIEFQPPNPLSASKFLTVMCLAENYIASDHEIRKLYEQNKHDMRKTVLQLQFYFQTGGDLTTRSPFENLDETVIQKANDENIYETDDENSKFSTISFEDRGIGAPIEHQHCQFSKFFGPEPKTCQTLGSTLEDIELKSRLHLLQSSKTPDGLVSNLSEEISEFLSFEKNEKQQKSKSPKLYKSLLMSPASPRHGSLDFEPILREICRTEKQRLANERKGSRFYHYLRSLNPNSLSKDYFDQFTTILRDS